MIWIRCRQCGDRSLRDHYPGGEFRCPGCDWREVLPPPEEDREKNAVAPPTGPVSSVLSTQPAPSKAAPVAAPEPDVADAPLPTAAAASDELDGITAAEFELWCARLFERFGYAVRAAGEEGPRDCDLILTKHAAVTYADCRIGRPDGVVGRAECQRLVGAMVGAGAARGIMVTTGTFDASCRAYAERLGPHFRLDLIDGDELRQTVRALESGPLAKWWQ